MDRFVGRLRELHERAKKGALSSPEHAEYAHARANLGRVLLVAQQIGQQGPTLRASLRMTSVVKVEVDLGGGFEKTTTIDLSEGGFAALLHAAHAVGRPAEFVLHLPDFRGGTRRVPGSAKVASCRPHGSLHRVSLTYTALAREDRAHLEMAIIDAVLSRMPAR